MSSPVFNLFFLPILLGVIFVATSAICAFRTPSTAQKLGLIIVLAAVGCAGAALYSIARGAWPSLGPHFAIALVFPIVVAQVVGTTMNVRHTRRQLPVKPPESGD